MITDNINFDKLLTDIDTQLEVLSAIAQDNPILSEHLRLFHETREMLMSQDLEISRLEELIDPDDLEDHSSRMERIIDHSTED